MKLALVNGSPKAQGSASEVLLREVRKLLCDAQIQDFSLKTPEADERQVDELLSCDVLVFAFPLYVDGIPSHLLSCLQTLEKARKRDKRKIPCRVFALVNSGFYDARQNRLALEMFEHWCARAGFFWGMGVGIGGGGMLPMLENVPAGKGPKKTISAALEKFVSAICCQGQTPPSGGMIFTAAAFPRFLYKLAAEYGWKQAARQNGIKPRRLSCKAVYVPPSDTDC